MLIREKALRVAEAELKRGVKEDPPGSNSGPRVNLYLKSAGLGPGYPWCMAFVNWCYRQAGLDLKHPNEASVGFFEAWAKEHGYLVGRPQPGDIVCYRWDGDDWPDHVGIVKEVGPTRIRVIEGNTAVGDDTNGGRVMLRSRSLSRCLFVRIPGAVSVKPKPTASTGGVVYVDVDRPGPNDLEHQSVENPALWARLKVWAKAKKPFAVKPRG